jgi:phytoene dehydrogenase-like protein
VSRRAATLAAVTDDPTRPPSDRYDVVVVGGGHNALVAAAYLGRAGLSVCVLERADHVGGAAVSGRVFAGVDARLSRYAYLVSLLPDRIVADLGLRLRLASRAVASFTPVRRGGADRGLLVERDPGTATADSFRELTGSDEEYSAWRAFYEDAATLAGVVAPTLLAPLEPADAMRKRVGEDVWDRLVARPIGEAIEAGFRDDAVRGVVLTDALIGTFASAHDADLRQNRCFLYHVIGNGTGEWRVPVGGMGAVTAELERAAREAGAHLVTGAEVVGVAADGRGAEVTYRWDDTERTVAGRYVLAGVAPAVLDRLRGRPAATPAPEGAQVKINMVLDRLPRLRSGHDPAVAFAGTFHIDEGYGALAAGYAAASAGRLPDPLPGEVYCHTLTDPSILAPDLAARGVHTLTLFGLHAPARLFGEIPVGAGAGAVGSTATTEAPVGSPWAVGPTATAEAPVGSPWAVGPTATAEAVRDEAVRRHLAGLDAYLAEPIADCLARDADGRPCLEAVSPLDLEASLGLPGGHIFHADLTWPWAADGAAGDGGAGAAGDTARAAGDADADRPDAQPGAWGVETDVANLFVCGAGARRGGGVSGVGGHNAAMAVLARVSARQ